MLKQRIITAIILIPLILVILIYGSNLLFALFTGLFLLAAAGEWTGFFGSVNKLQRSLYIVFMAVMMIISLFVSIPAILFTAFIWWLIAAFLIVTYPRRSQKWIKGRFVRMCMGVLVLVPCWVALNYIHSLSDGVAALLFLFILIWGADTAAYFAGKAVGKRKLAPQVSPGKSIEGAVAALLFGVLYTITIQWLTHIPAKVWLWGIMLSVLTVCFSIIGDLFESLLKREAGIKDSSKILPGHGGLLDRIDSLTAAAPTFTFLALLAGFYFE